MNAFDESLINDDIDNLIGYVRKYVAEEGEELGGDLFAYLYDAMDYSDHHSIEDYLKGWYIDSREAFDLLTEDILQMREDGEEDTEEYEEATEARDLLEDDTLVDKHVVTDYEEPTNITGSELISFLRLCKKD